MFMKIIISITVLLALCILYTNNLLAQNSLNSGGGDASSETIKFSYSIGEIIHSEIRHSAYYASQGVQHPALTILNPTFTEGIIYWGNIIKVYPNPVSADVHFEFALPVVTKVKVRLFDINGKLCLDKTINTNENIISLSKFKTGMYILQVFESEIEIFNSKIIKN